MRLHYRTPDAEEKVALVKEGELIHCPAGTPHSPRFSPDSFVLVLVANVPEGLPATIASCLQISAKRMAARNVMLKRTNIIETLGACSVIG